MTIVCGHCEGVDGFHEPDCKVTAEEQSVLINHPRPAVRTAPCPVCGTAIYFDDDGTVRHLCG